MNGAWAARELRTLADEAERRAKIYRQFADHCERLSAPPGLRAMEEAITAVREAMGYPRDVARGLNALKLLVAAERAFSAKPPNPLPTDR